ncbi:exonuclease 1-like, partial [Trifolium medium]|nr:exonuclease 1-like [Trifolium medium]
PSVPGIGVARAHALVSKYQNIDRILSVLKFEKGDQMPEDYAKSFNDALAVFQHARIYDINTKELKHMKPLPENFLESLNENLDFLGPYP